MCVGASVAGAQSATPDSAPKPFSITRSDPALDALIALDAKLKTVASGFGFADTPLWIRGQKGAEGYLVAVSIIDNVVYKVAPNGKVSVWLDKAGYSGEDFLHDGKLALIGRMDVILMGPGCVAIDGQGRTVGARGAGPRDQATGERWHAHGAGGQVRGQALQLAERCRHHRGRRHLFHRLGRGFARRDQWRPRGDA